MADTTTALSPSSSSTSVATDPSGSQAAGLNDTMIPPPASPSAVHWPSPLCHQSHLGTLRQFPLNPTRHRYHPLDTLQDHQLRHVLARPRRPQLPFVICKPGVQEHVEVESNPLKQNAQWRNEATPQNEFGMLLEAYASHTLLLAHLDFKEGIFKLISKIKIKKSGG